MIPCSGRILKHNYYQQPNPSYPRFFTPFLPSSPSSLRLSHNYVCVECLRWMRSRCNNSVPKISHHRYTNVYSPPILSFTVYLCLLSFCFIKCLLSSYFIIHGIMFTLFLFYHSNLEVYMPQNVPLTFPRL